MLTEDKKTNLKKPNKEKLLNMLNIPFIKPDAKLETDLEKKKNKLMPHRLSLKNKNSYSSDDSSDSSSSASDKYPVKNIEITYDGITYIYDNGNLYNKTKIGLKGKLFGTFKNGKIRPNKNELIIYCHWHFSYIIYNFINIHFIIYMF